MQFVTYEQLAGIIEPLNDRINKPEKKLSGPAECGGETQAGSTSGSAGYTSEEIPPDMSKKKKAKKK